MSMKTQFIRLPINIHYNGKIVSAEITGQSQPFNRYFTCRIPGADIVIIEAFESEKSGAYSWEVCYGKQLGYIVPFIGKEIEKQLGRNNKLTN